MSHRATVRLDLSHALWDLVLWFGCAVGLSLVVVAFHLAADGSSDGLEFHVFWIGVLVALLPALLFVLAPSSDRHARQLGLLATVGILSLPKVLLVVAGTKYHDEYPHLREVQAVIDSGHLFQPVSILPIVHSFPGLHAVTAALALVGSTNAWTAAVLVALGAHALTVLGVYVLAIRVTGSDRAAAIAAVLYALNPSFMYFDAQFAYESLAVCYFVWALAFAVHIRAGALWRPAVLAALLCVACVCTHHLTTLILVLVLTLLAVTHTVAWRHGGSGAVAATLWLLAVATGAGFALWTTVVAPDTYDYLSPYLGSSLNQLVEIGGTSGGSRTLYAGTTVPVYERLFAFATPLIVFAAAVLATVQAVRTRALDATRIAFWALAAAYFISLPFILTSSGAEGARRTWAFSYVGLVLLVGPWLDHLLRPVAVEVRRRLLPALVALALVVVLIGNVSADLNAEYRFPGPFTFGSDTRSQTAETVAMARWLRADGGTGARVVTDRFTGLTVGSVGAARLAVGSADFPIWDLYTSTSLPPGTLLSQLRSSGYQYLVIDKRLATQISQSSTYFDSGEPVWSRQPAFTVAALSKYDGFAWTAKVYDSASYAVYRFDFGALPASAFASTSGGAT